VVIPEPIQQYLTVVKNKLGLLLEWPESELSSEEKLNFFRWAWCPDP
jgi:hypothetical protein